MVSYRRPVGFFGCQIRGAGRRVSRALSARAGAVRAAGVSMRGWTQTSRVRVDDVAGYVAAWIRPRRASRSDGTARWVVALLRQLCPTLGC